MPAYFIVQSTIKDEAQYQKYVQAVVPFIASFGGKLVARRAKVEVLEGEHDERPVVMFEFPNMEAIRANFSGAMKDPALRFWAVEHITMMMAAVVLVHVGRVLARKAVTPAAKRVRLLLCFGLATLLMILATPWPGMTSGRPLFRLD